jgi:hypothetical protein
MPINPSALGGPDPQDPGEAQDIAQHVAEQQQREQQEETGKRPRRNKAQMIADAVVPADDEQVDLKDAGTGARIQRRWSDAVEMVREDKAEFADKAMKYSMIKYDQQAAVPAFQEPEVEQGEPVSTEEQVAKLVAELLVVPPDAEIGDEVSIGSDTFRVGHGGVLIDGSRPVSVDGELVRPKRRWLREIGAGPNGPWESVDAIGSAPREAAEVTRIVAQENGKGGEVYVETERQPAEIRQVGQIEWKVGTGILDKIGLPDYSSLAIGPITTSRMVVDDGRRTTVAIGSREATLPTAVVEAFQEITDIVEYVARYQRGELISFMESVGALKQPVS